MRYILVLCIVFVLSVSSRALAQSTNDSSSIASNTFVDVSREPQETVPLESLIHYPKAARRSGLEGKVTVQALIDKDGSVGKVEVVESSNDIFNHAALDAMKHAHFTPAMINATPLKIWITRIINFRLKNRDTSSQDILKSK